MNIEADSLAEDFQRHEGKLQPLAHRLPSCSAMVLIRVVSIEDLK